MSTLSYLDRLLDGAAVEWVPLGELGELVRGHGLPKSDFTATGVPAIHYGQIYTHYGMSTTSTKSFVAPETAASLKKVNYGDVVITNTSENFEDVATPLAYFGKEQAVTGGHATIIKPGNSLLAMYFAHFTQTPAFEAEKRRYAKGIKVIDVSAADMAKILIPIPSPGDPQKSLAIQAEIVRILDGFTALTAQLKAELNAELAARRKQYKYYGDQLLTFDADEVEWKTLGELAENLDSKRKPITSSLREPGMIPYYGASGIVDYVKDYIFDGNYLLVSEDGANLLARNTSIAFSISGKTWVNNHAHVLKFKTYADQKFVEYYLNNIDLTPYVSGAAQPKLNKNNLSSIRIPDPTAKEKSRIVALLDKFDALSSSLRERLTSEIDLRDAQYGWYRDQLLSFPRPDEGAA